MAFPSSTGGEQENVVRAPGLFATLLLPTDGSSLRGPPVGPAVVPSGLST
jgi:hypothetical protein